MIENPKSNQPKLKKEKLLSLGTVSPRRASLRVELDPADQGVPRAACTLSISSLHPVSMLASLVSHLVMARQLPAALGFHPYKPKSNGEKK